MNWILYCACSYPSVKQIFKIFWWEVINNSSRPFCHWGYCISIFNIYKYFHRLIHWVSNSHWGRLGFLLFNTSSHFVSADDFSKNQNNCVHFVQYFLWQPCFQMLPVVMMSKCISGSWRVTSGLTVSGR